MEENIYEFKLGDHNVRIRKDHRRSSFRLRESEIR